MIEVDSSTLPYINKEFILNNVQFCVSNVDGAGGRNEVISIPFLDLLIYFRFHVVSNDHLRGTSVVTKDIADLFGLTVDELFQCSCENAERAGYFIKSLSSLLVEDLAFGLEEYEGYEEPEDIKSKTLCIMTNYDRQYGAAGILLRTRLEKFCEETGAEKLIILPSSIHEILLVPSGLTDNDTLKSVVNDINNSDVISEDIFLSNNIYIYTKGKSVEIYREELFPMPDEDDFTLIEGDIDEFFGGFNIEQ